MTDSGSNGRVYHRAAPTQRIDTQKKSWDAACEASNQAEEHSSRSEGGRGFYSSQTELEPGEPQRAAPFPTVGAARTPMFNAPISESTHLACAAGRKHQGVGRKRAAIPARPGISMCYLLRQLTEDKQGWEVVVKGCKFQTISPQVHTITVLNDSFKWNTGDAPV